jgi:hypothetical protein
MKNLIIAFAILALLTSVAGARVATERVDREMTGPEAMTPTRNVTFFLDQMDAGEGLWTHVDNTASGPQPIRWHVTTHLAHPSGTYSYFCGVEPPTGWAGDVAGDGGYGNDWDQRLDMPVIDWTGAVYPLLSYSTRFDLEPNYDYGTLEAQVSGVFVSVMASDKRHTGISGGGLAPVWVDQVGVGWDLLPYDKPMVARMRMTSDPGYSDEDGSYDSQCGAIHMDNFLIWDYYGTGQWWADDVEDGVGDCTFSVPAPGVPAGDFWHIIYSKCHGGGSEYAWWCGDDADTSGNLNLIAGIENSLFTPEIDISSALTCTFYWRFAPFMPFLEPEGVTPDYGWKEYIWVDGTAYANGYYAGSLVHDYGAPGICYYAFNSYESLDGHGLLPASTFQYEVEIIGDPVLGIPGYPGEDISSLFWEAAWVYGQDVTSVEESSWGNIKAMYR